MNLQTGILGEATVDLTRLRWNDSPVGATTPPRIGPNCALERDIDRPTGQVAAETNRPSPPIEALTGPVNDPGLPAYRMAGTSPWRS